MNPSTGDACVVIVFARAPTPGSCKTRLIGRYGAIGAARLYRHMIARTLRVARASDCGRVEVWVDPDPGHPAFAPLRRLGLALRRQPRGDLGRRMARAMAGTLRGGAGTALLIGTDAADLRAQDLRDAAAALGRGECDALLQPALDGGFVMIGLRRDPGTLLRGVAWSSGRELRQATARLQRGGLRVLHGSARRDLDHPADVRAARRLGLL